MKRKIFYPILAFVIVFAMHVIYSVWKEMQIAEKWVQIGNSNLLSLYFKQQNYLLGFSYAMAGAFTVYAFFKFLESRKRGGLAGLIGGVGLTGILYFGGCFLLGCCGSPMIAVYLAFFGSSFLGFTKPLVLLITTISIVIGYFWIEKKTKISGCCAGNEKFNDVSVMTDTEAIKKIQSELKKGMNLAKCRKCGCMKDALETLRSSDLRDDIERWLTQMEPIKYSCLGCKYCFPAVATNIFNQTFPDVAQNKSSNSGFTVMQNTWPAVPGEYFAKCYGESCPVAVSTLSSVELAEKLAHHKPKELCIVGKTETENIGIDKLIKNTISNNTIRFLILAGKDSQGHQSGKTLLTLWQNGVDENMRVIDSPGNRPILNNVTRNEVEIFRKQVKLVDMIGCEDVKIIVEEIREISKDIKARYSCKAEDEKDGFFHNSTVPIIQAKKIMKVEMDKSGYFVIIPQREKGIITVEHYSYNNKLLRMIEGKDVRSIYSTIIENGWVSQLSHSAYLGKELAKAELSIKLGFKYVQEGA